MQNLGYFPSVRPSQKYCKRFSHVPSSRNFLFLVWTLNKYGMGNELNCCDRHTLFMYVGHIHPLQQDSCGTVPSKSFLNELNKRFYGAIGN